MNDTERNALNREIDLHNDSQEKIVQRAQDMIKTLLLLSGGALAVCANFFSTGKKINSEAVLPIQLAWTNLTLSIIMFGITLLLLLGRDYRFGENRAASLDSGKLQVDTSPIWDIGIWSAGLIGFFSFTLGMIAFCYAAFVYLQTNI
ncbi:MAG: hypothetical protein ACNJA3_09765 [Pseudomonas rhizophila]|uniref:hypothetical protein n=1 Tax=Pseudomonas TaxID=286 RepID=UPI00064063A5|nr:hypothetical protein [Pseudomonas brassicacearum]